MNITQEAQDKAKSLLNRFVFFPFCILFSLLLTYGNHSAFKLSFFLMILVYCLLVFCLPYFFIRSMIIKPFIKHYEKKLLKQYAIMQQQVFNFSEIEQKFRHKQELEKLILEYNLKFLEAELNNRLQDKRITYDGLNAILMRLIERATGLSEQATADDVSRWVDEAMGQAYK